LVSLLLNVALSLAAFAALLAVYRLLMGPDPESRAVAMDVLGLIVMPMMAGYALSSGRVIYLDVALVYGILSFLGVTSLARYLDRGL